MRIARRHYENFPVASWLLPADSRPHIAAVYAFARTADDFADEGHRSPEARLVLLDEWQARLDRAVHGEVDDDGSEAAHIFRALRQTIRSHNIDPSLLGDLLSAFRQDVTVKRYETWTDLFDYCRRSANPIGRLVLAICGYRGEALARASDDVCTALQLTNFWQDLERDWTKGRLYVPLEVAKHAGAIPGDFDRRHMSPEWRSALRRAAEKTRELFAEGRAVADAVRGRLKWELRATWLGGMRILERLDAVDYDVFRFRPELRWTDATLIGWRMIVWR